MAAGDRGPILLLILCALAAAFAPSSALAQAAQRDGITELLAKQPATKVAETAGPPAPAATTPATAAPGAAAPLMGPPAPPPAAPKDPREGEQAYEQARQLMLAIDAVLQDTAQQRSEALPFTQLGATAGVRRA